MRHNLMESQVVIADEEEGPERSAIHGGQVVYLFRIWSSRLWCQI